MQDERNKPAAENGQKDQVEEAAAESFPASDPPAWTATRSGPPRDPRAASGPPANDSARCTALAAFASERHAQAAAESLLAAGLNIAEIKPSRRSREVAGVPIPHRADTATVGLCAIVGASAAAIAAALSPRPRSVASALSVAVGGLFGGVLAAVAAPRRRPGEGQADRRGDAWLLRFELKSPDEERRALQALQPHGIRLLHVRWIEADRA